jgi:glutathione S-transferase
LVAGFGVGAPHGALEEAGAKYELTLVTTTPARSAIPAYLKLNPNGKVPTLVVGRLNS